MTAIVPEKGKNFKSTFLYKDAFKANYILNSPTSVSPSSTGTNTIKLFVAAKEVEEARSRKPWGQGQTLWVGLGHLW